MNLLDALLRRLEEEQAEHAKRALAQPQNRDSFEYGRVAGIACGKSSSKFGRLTIARMTNFKEHNECLVRRLTA